MKAMESDNRMMMGGHGGPIMKAMESDDKMIMEGHGHRSSKLKDVKSDKSGTTHYREWGSLVA
jgi:hypothetical protein